MAPRVKRVYRSSSTNSNQSNRRRSISLYEKDLNKDAPLLKSYTTPTSQIKNQKQQVQKMQNDLQIRERKILQNITNLRNINNNTGISHKESAHKSEIIINEQVLPNDINENYFLEEFPSFVASPIVFKEASFRFNTHQTGVEDSFLIFDESKVYIDDDEDNSEEVAKISSSSSPNKVPGSSDLHDSGHEFQDFYQVTINDEIKKNNLSSSHDSNQSLPFASPVSEKSISRPQTEIDFFTIDPEFLRSFEGIWQKTLDFPIRSADPESPDHFELFKGRPSSSIHKRKKKPNCI